MKRVFSMRFLLSVVFCGCLTLSLLPVMAAYYNASACGGMYAKRISLWLLDYEKSSRQTWLRVVIVDILILFYFFMYVFESQPRDRLCTLVFRSFVFSDVRSVHQNKYTSKSSLDDAIQREVWEGSIQFQIGVVFRTVPYHSNVNQKLKDIKYWPASGTSNHILRSATVGKFGHVIVTIVVLWYSKWENNLDSCWNKLYVVCNSE
jgi:hypothetical protein